MRVTGFSSSLVTTATLPFSSPDPFSGQRCGEMDGPSRWKCSGPPRSSWPRRFGTWIRPGIARKMGRCQRRMGSFVNSNLQTTPFSFGISPSFVRFLGGSKYQTSAAKTTAADPNIFSAKGRPFRHNAAQKMDPGMRTARLQWWRVMRKSQ